MEWKLAGWLLYSHAMLQVPTVTGKKIAPLTIRVCVCDGVGFLSSERPNNERGRCSISPADSSLPAGSRPRSAQTNQRARVGKRQKSPTVEFFYATWGCTDRAECPQPNVTMPMRLNSALPFWCLRLCVDVSISYSLRSRSCLLLRSIPSAGFDGWQNRAAWWEKEASKSNRQTARNEKVSTTVL